MTSRDDDSRTERRPGRRRHTTAKVAGAVTLLAALGGTAYAVTSQLTEKDPATGGPTAAAERPLAAAPASPAATPPANVTKPWQSMSPDEQKQVRERIDAAREAMAKKGVKLTRPLEAKPHPGATGEATTSTSGSLNKDGITRVTTAKYDLTGQKDLLWAADGGKKVGPASCTQKFRFSRDAPAQERSTMLMCWRTSAKKSVVTVTVEKTGRPSVKSNLEVLSREWAKLK